MYLIRADGNARIGAGHLMRCLTVADAVLERQDILFVCADLQSAKVAESRGYRTKVIGTDYREMEAELPFWEKHWEGERLVMDQEQAEIMLVDSYQITDRYLLWFRDKLPVIIMDDMGRHAYPAAGVVNYNAFAKEDNYLKLYDGTNIPYFIGPRYAPVGKQFIAAGYQVRKAVGNILITAGGGDIFNISGKILEAIYAPGVHFHVVSGRFNPYFELLKQWESNHGNVHIYHDVKDMAALMEICDLAVTAGGTTVYELAAMGVPFICFAYADNQQQLTGYINDTGMAGYGGDYRAEPEATLLQIARLCKALSADYNRRRAMSAREREMIDGSGAGRLADIIRNFNKYRRKPYGHGRYPP